MEAGRRWLFSATLLATTAILLSFILSYPERLQANKHHSSRLDSLRKVQWNLVPIDSMDLTDMPALRPIADSFPLVSGFGMRLHPILQEDRMHAGIDFAAPDGADVFATADGVVEHIAGLNDSSTFGIHIILLHDSSAFFSGRYRSLYAHLSGVKVTKGQRVSQGQIIGEVGSTGRSTAAHLHYEVHLDGEPVNPLEYLPGSELPLSSDSAFADNFLHFMGR